MDSVFLADLARLGPDADYVPYTFSQARIYCARLTNSHYENFSVASLLLPRRLLRHFHAVYAYCRWADDLADEAGGGQHALDLLAWWRTELNRCYDGTPCHPVMVALRETVRKFDIPRQPFLDLLIAFEQDQVIHRYSTFEQLVGYCRNSANPVGRLVLYLCEAFNEKNAELSDDICTALQLANFWQDVGRDLDIGRVYLPEEDRRRFGYSDADLEARRFTPGFAKLLRFEVDRTHKLFRCGLPLIDLVPEDVSADIELFLRGGQATLRKIEQQGYNVWQARPSLSKMDRASLLGKALLRRWLPGFASSWE